MTQSEIEQAEERILDILSGRYLVRIPVQIRQGHLILTKYRKILPDSLKTELHYLINKVDNGKSDC